MYTISRTNKDNPDFKELISELDVYLNGQYGERQSQYDAFNGIDTLDAVVIASEGETPIGCGAYKKFDDKSVELKRMFVKPDFRTSGVGSLLLTELENWAVEDGYESCVLETGDNQPEAIQFYKKHNYAVIPNYPPYDKISTSICMKKELI